MKIILIVSLFFSLAHVAHAEYFDCANLSNRAEEKGAYLNSIPSYEVIGKERLYFHYATNEICKEKVFVIHGDYLTGYTEFNDWVSHMYFNKNGDTFQGWVRKNRLKYAGNNRPDNRD